MAAVSAIPMWEVVGGADKGGILVREGPSTTDKAIEERLSHGARIEELEMKADRLHYRLQSGKGPQEGWVAIKISGKDLCTKVSDGEASASEPEPPVPDSAPRTLQPACVTAAPFSPNKTLGPFVKVMKKAKFLDEVLAKRLPGDWYGLRMPQTPEELFTSESFGTKWLTMAFQAAGSLPKGNAVARVVSWKRFTGGGSGPKAAFEVEYKEPKPELDTKLFLKMPWTKEENAEQRYIECGQAKFGDNWGGELLFYRYLAPHMPFACPKLYFGDISRESTEAILINAGVEWPEDGKTDFKPYEILPPCGKCEDYVLTNPEDYYFAIMRRLGTFAGLAKAGKLGDDIEKQSWMHMTASTDIFVMASFPGNEKFAKSFVEDVAPHWFDEKLRTKANVDKLASFIAELPSQLSSIAKYLYEDPAYVGFHHQNGNTDNAYFFRREDGKIDCGLLDWGSTAKMSYASGLMGASISAMAVMLAEYEERLVQMWVDAYHVAGAPRINLGEMLLRYRLATCVHAYGSFTMLRNLESFVDTVKSAKDISSPEIRGNFGLKFGLSMIYNRTLLFLMKGDTFRTDLRVWANKTKQGKGQ